MKNRIGENIKNIRKAYGETQRELGIVLNVKDNAISQYESGERVPDMNILQTIAEHYGLTVDRLINDDFNEADYKLSSLTWNKVHEIFEIMFPIICTEKAKEDECFAKGYNHTMRIWNEFTENGAVTQTMFNRAYEEYEKSLIRNCTLESAANMLWLIFTEYALMPDEHSYKMGEAVWHGKSCTKDFVKKYVLKDSNPISNEDEERKKKYVRENREKLTMLIKKLKNSTQYSALAEYYLAIQYLVGVAKNDSFSDEMNKAIGLEMLTLFGELGNTYALSYIKEIMLL